MISKTLLELELSHDSFDIMGNTPDKPAKESKDGAPAPPARHHTWPQSNKWQNQPAPMGDTNVTITQKPCSGPPSVVEGTTHEVPGSIQTAVGADPMDGSTKSRALPISQSLGGMGCTVIFGGSPLLLLVVGFLLFLWRGEGPAAGGAHATVPWRTIMLHGWATRAVTLSTFVLATIMVGQAGICTSMVAGLLIEQRHWPISTMARLSMFRGVNVAPHSLLEKPRSFHPKYLGHLLSRVLSRYSVLLVVVAVTSLSTGLFSTILLSDFGTAVLIQPPTQTRHNVAMSESTLNLASVSSSLFFENLHGWLAFAEMETANLAEPNTNGISDTMLRERAFLPYDRDQRVALRQFRGPTAVMASRISCVPPVIYASFNPLYPDNTYPYGSINGTNSYESTFKHLNMSTEMCSYDILHQKTVCLPPNFACSVPNGLALSQSKSLTSWVSSLCHLAIPEIESEVPADPVTTPTNIEDLLGASAGRWNRDSEPWNEASHWPFLVITTNSQIEILNTMNKSDIRMLPLRYYQRYGEWSSYRLNDSSLVNITLCSAGFNMSLAEVEMSSNMDPKEPTVRVNTTTEFLDAEEVQFYLGASGVLQTPQDRGILSIRKLRYLESNASMAGLDPFQPKTGTGSFRCFLFYNSLMFWERLGIMVRGWTGGWSVSMCNSCWAQGNPISRDVGVLFTRIINTSCRAAFAIDAVLFAIMSNWYYDFLPGFNVPGTVEASFSQLCNIPRQWKGITAVITIVVVHLICVLIIAWLYIKNIRYTRQGNIWHTVAQLASAPTYPTLESATEMLDEDVEKKLLEDDRLFTIDRSQSGRVEVMLSSCEE